MSDEKNSGASYLAALKQTGTLSGAALARAPVSAGEGPTPGSGSNPSEKRRSTRYRCQGSAHLREISTGIGTWATFTDISLHGCYVEAMSTFPKGAELGLTLEVHGYRFECRGSVRIVYPGLGMGVAFTTISTENRERLTELLQSLGQPSGILGTRAGLDHTAATKAEVQPQVKDPVAALQALSQFFEQRDVLGREEFLRILRKSQP